MKEKIINGFLVALMFILVFKAVQITEYRFQHPEATETQLFLKYFGIDNE